jgi:hypothetical protein
MKVLILFCLFFNLKLLNNKLDCKNVIIEWVDNVDKPIQKIIICNNCKSITNDLNKFQCSVSLKTLKEINLILNDNKYINVNKININEKNKIYYIDKLKSIKLVLAKNNENIKLIEQIDKFINRIDY